MGAVELASAVTYPQKVRGRVEPVTTQRILTHEGLFIGEDERFVARVEIHFVQRTLSPKINTAGAHESHGPFDIVSDSREAFSFDGLQHKLLVPSVHA